MLAFAGARTAWTTNLFHVSKPSDRSPPFCPVCHSGPRAVAPGTRVREVVGNTETIPGESGGRRHCRWESRRNDRCSCGCTLACRCDGGTKRGHGMPPLRRPSRGPPMLIGRRHQALVLTPSAGGGDEWRNYRLDILFRQEGSHGGALATASCPAFDMRRSGRRQECRTACASAGCWAVVRFGHIKSGTIEMRLRSEARRTRRLRPRPRRLRRFDSPRKRSNARQHQRVV